MSFLNIKSSLKNYNFWVLAWVVLVVSYAASMHYGINEKNWDNLTYFLQLAVDICIAVFGYLAYKSKSDLVSNRFYFLIFLSVIPGLFANEVYNVLVNIVGLKEINHNVNISWVIAYTAFLLIQIFAWSYLYLSHQAKEEGRQKLTAFIQPAIIVFLSFICIIVFRNTILAEVGKMGVINSLLETIFFIGVSTCLARTKSKSLIYLEVGFLLLISFNLAHRFSYNTGHYFRTFDVVWLISLVTIAFGLFEAWKDKKTVEFFKSDSLHVYASAIFLAFSTFLLIVFIVVDLILSSATMSKVGYSNILP